MAEINEFISPKAQKQIDQYIKDISAISKEYGDITQASKKYNDSLKKQAKNVDEVDDQTKQYNALLKQLNTTQAKIEVSESNINKELIKAKEALSQKNRKIKESIQLENAETNSINSLRQANKKLAQQRNALNLETEKGRKSLDELNKSIDANNKKIKSNLDTRGKEIQSVGSYKKSINEALGEQEAFGVSLDGLSAMFTTATGLIGAGALALSGLAKGYLSSARGANDLARASDRLDSIMTQLGNNIADVTGDEGFLDRTLAGLQAQFFGIANSVQSTVIVAIKQAIRELEVLEVDQERQKKAQLDRAEVLRQIRDEERNSFEDRKKANNELADIIDARESESIEFQEKRLKQYQALLNADKDNLALQKEVKQIEFEIADIREEAQGFRSEQLINDLALSREFNENQVRLTEERVRGELLVVEKGSIRELELRRELLGSLFALELEAAGQNEQLQDISKAKFLNDLKELEQGYTDYVQTKIDKDTEYTAQAEESATILAETGIQASLEAQQRAARDTEVQLQLDEIKKQSGINTAFSIASAASNLLGQQTVAGKIAAVTEATISGYVATMNTFRDTTGPLFLGVTAAAAGSFAIKNIRQILSVDTSIPPIQTVPAFAKGTDSTPGGTWLAGEKGRELKVDRSGAVSLVENPTLFTNEIGSKIIKNSDTERILRGDNKTIQNNFNDERIIEAIQNSQPIMGINKFGIITISKKNKGLTKRLNDRYRN